MPLRILFVPFGSEGDVNPLFTLADRLAARGHEIVFLLTPHYKAHAERRGFRWIPIGTEEDFRRVANDPRAWDRLRGPEFVVKNLVDSLPAFQKAFSTLQEPIDLVVTSTFGLAAAALAEAAGIPRLNLHLQPVCLHSTFDCPLFVSELAWLRHAPRFIKRLAFRCIDLVFWRLLKKPINHFRRELNLPPLRNFFDEAIHGGDGVAALFPSWFAAPQPDWPELRQFGFPPTSPKNQLPTDLENFLAAGSPPVLWTHGSANFDTKAFQANAIATSTRLGLRSLLVSLAAPPSPLPVGVLHLTHIRFEDVFPRVAAVVHHGGIGTVAKAIGAGIPQLIIPRSHDQPDNARRVVALGLGKTLPYRTRPGGDPRIDRALQELITSPTIRARCREFQTLMASGDDWPALADWAEDLARR